jgi:hypothetical protein
MPSLYHKGGIMLLFGGLGVIVFCLCSWSFRVPLCFVAERSSELGSCKVFMCLTLANFGDDALPLKTIQNYSFKL